MASKDGVFDTFRCGSPADSCRMDMPDFFQAEPEDGVESISFEEFPPPFNDKEFASSIKESLLLLIEDFQVIYENGFRIDDNYGLSHVQDLEEGKRKKRIKSYLDGDLEHGGAIAFLYRNEYEKPNRLELEARRSIGAKLEDLAALISDRAVTLNDITILLSTMVSIEDEDFSLNDVLNYFLDLSLEPIFTKKDLQKRYGVDIGTLTRDLEREVLVRNQEPPFGKAELREIGLFVAQEILINPAIAKLFSFAEAIHYYDVDNWQAATGFLEEWGYDKTVKGSLRKHLFKSFAVDSVFVSSSKGVKLVVDPFSIEQAVQEGLLPPIPVVDENDFKREFADNPDWVRIKDIPGEDDGANTKKQIYDQIREWIKACGDNGENVARIAVRSPDGRVRINRVEWAESDFFVDRDYIIFDALFSKLA